MDYNMPNTALATIKAKIEGADTIGGPDTPPNTLTAMQNALQAAIAAKNNALIARDNAIQSRDQAIAAKNQAIRQRDQALAAADPDVVANIAAKDAQIAELTARLDAANAGAIAGEHAALVAYLGRDIARAAITAIADQEETGEPITPDPVVILDGVTLVKDTDYTVAYADNTDAGTATVIVTGKGTKFGSKSVTFEIVAGGGGEGGGTGGGDPPDEGGGSTGGDEPPEEE